MTIRRVSRAAGLMLALAPGCGGGPDPVPADLPTCPASTMRLEGTVGGIAISFSQPIVGGGFDQDDNGGKFVTQRKPQSGRRDAASVDVELSWGGPLLGFDESRDARGTTLLPTGAPGFDWRTPVRR